MGTLSAQTAGVLPQEWELTQCLFGEHLLKKYPDKDIWLVEAKKTAIIDTEIDGAIGMNSGIFNNPFIIWADTKRDSFATTLHSHSSSITPRWTEPMQVNS